VTLARVSCAVVLALVACGKERQTAADGAAERPGVEPATLEGGAIVSGTVTFSGTPPANPPINMAEEPACMAQYDGTPRDPRVVVTDGRLAHVFVYVKDGLSAAATYQVPATPAVIDQRGCLYHPRVLGLVAGQRLEIRNSDSLLHNIKAVPARNRGFNVSQPAAGMTTERSFSQPEVMIPLECNVHGWMQARVGVLPHPFFAVTGADGGFRIAHLPPGTYTIEAWHETLGTRTATVTVADTAAALLDFTFAAK